MAYTLSSDFERRAGLHEPNTRIQYVGVDALRARYYICSCTRPRQVQGGVFVIAPGSSKGQPLARKGRKVKVLDTLARFLRTRASAARTRERRQASAPPAKGRPARGRECTAGVQSFPPDPGLPQLGPASDPELMRKVFQNHLRPLGERSTGSESAGFQASATAEACVACCSIPCASKSPPRGASGTSG